MAKEKIKLLIATDNFLPRWDGIARFLLETMPFLYDDFEITVIGPKFKGVLPDMPIKVLLFDIKDFSIGDFNPAKQDNKKIEEQIKKNDIVWVQTIGPIGYNTIKIAKKNKKPIAAFTHSIEWELVPSAVSFPLFKGMLHRITKRIAKRMYNKADILMSPSEETSEKFSISGVNSKKRIITLGIDTNKFKPTGDKAAAKKAVGISEDRVVIGYTGRIAREKDLFTLYRAFSKVQKTVPNATLLIVGDGLDSIKRAFRNKSNIILAGQQDNVVAYLQAMDIYVLPSLTETTSLSTLEAMSCGLTVFATRVGYIKNYIKEGVNGYLFPKKNAYLLSKKLELASKDEKLRERIGKKARETVEERFLLKKTGQKIRETLLELVNRK